MFLKPRLSLLLTPVLAASMLSAQEAPKPGAPAPTAPAGSSAAAPAPAGAEGQPPADGFRGRRRSGGFGGPPGGLGNPLAGEGLPEATEDGPRINGNIVEPFQFPNNSVADLLAFYERLTGMTLVKDTAIFDGSPISLVTTKQMDKAEAIRLVEATLLVNGYAIVTDPAGKSARILPTRAPGAAQMQFSQGVKFYTDPKDIPEGETLVTYFMKLEHLTPEEAGGTLANHVGLNVYGRLTPVASPPGLLITESANIVRHLIGIRDVIDVAPTNSSLVTKFIKLDFADAPVVAQIVQATLDAQAKDKQTKGLTTIRGQGMERAPKGAPGAPAAPAAQAPGGVSGGHLDPSGQKTSTEPAAQVIADPRLNQILVVASPEDYTYVSSLIKEFDKPVDVPEPFERKLNYVFSVDVLSSLSDLLKDTSTGVSQLPGGGTLNLNANQQPLMSSSSQLLAGRKSTNTRGATLATSGAAAASTDSSSGSSAVPPTSSVADQLIPPQEDNAPISILVNKTRIIADPQSNTIFVMGSKEAVDKISKLLDKLDKKPAQVYLATVIGELSLDNGLNYGIDYLTKFNSAGQNKGFSSSFIQQQPGITGSITDVRNNLITSPFGPAAGFNVYGQIGSAVDVFVNALETTNKFKVLSRPAVFALNNKKASITSGSIIPVPSQSITAAGNNVNGNGSVTTTVAFRQVVLKLEVVPLINPNKEITLTIAQINDTVTGSQRIEPNDVPIIGTEQIITTVTVPSGHTVVLGGLISETDKKATNGIPWVSRIPVLGNLLKTTDNKFSRKELLIFIQPQVVEDQMQLAKASLNEDLRSKVGEDAYKTFPPQPLSSARYSTTTVSTVDKAPAGLLPGERKGNWFQRTFGRKTIPDRQVNPLR